MRPTSPGCRVVGTVNAMKIYVVSNLRFLPEQPLPPPHARRSVDWLRGDRHG